MKPVSEMHNEYYAYSNEKQCPIRRIQQKIAYVSLVSILRFEYILWLYFNRIRLHSMSVASAAMERRLERDAQFMQLSDRRFARTEKLSTFVLGDFTVISYIL